MKDELIVLQGGFALPGDSFLGKLKRSGYEFK
jgi:hypothetical protein